MDDLKKMRDAIDEIDQQIIHLLKERFELSEEVGRYKKQHGFPILNQSREEEILATLPTDEIKAVYLTIFKRSRGLQK